MAVSSVSEEMHKEATEQEYKWEKRGNVLTVVNY
jgi:hypothetical protein